MLRTISKTCCCARAFWESCSTRGLSAVWLVEATAPNAGRPVVPPRPVDAPKPSDGVAPNPVVPKRLGVEVPGTASGALVPKSEGAVELVWPKLNPPGAGLLKRPPVAAVLAPKRFVVGCAGCEDAPKPKPGVAPNRFVAGCAVWAAVPNPNPVDPAAGLPNEEVFFAPNRPPPRMGWAFDVAVTPRPKPVELTAEIKTRTLDGNSLTNCFDQCVFIPGFVPNKPVEAVVFAANAVPKPPKAGAAAVVVVVLKSEPAAGLAPKMPPDWTTCAHKKMFWFLYNHLGIRYTAIITHRLAKRWCLGRRLCGSKQRAVCCSSWCSKDATALGLSKGKSTGLCGSWLSAKKTKPGGGSSGCAPKRRLSAKDGI